MKKKFWIILIIVALILGATFYFLRPKGPKKRISSEAAAKVAIVLDDWGYNMNNVELCYIEQKLFALMPQFNIYIDGKQVSTVRKKFNLAKKRTKKV